MSSFTQWLARWRRRQFIVRALKGAARSWALRRYLERPEVRAGRVQCAVLGENGRVVFVCHGNIMRSAYAAQVARQQYPHLAHRVADGGTHAKQGRPPQDSALRVSRELQAPLDGHEATPMAMLALSPHDIVVCMDAMNEANVLAAYPALASRVFRVGDIASAGMIGVANQSSQQGVSHDDREVRDPYGEGDDSTRDAFARIARLVDHWMVQAGARNAM